MAGLPITIPLPSESATASYSWTDIADGTGVVKLYLFTTTNNSATAYKLASNVKYSSSQGVGGDLVNTDVDFDLTAFNTPRVIEGTAILELGYQCRGFDVLGGGGSLSAVCNLYKVSGGVETLIGTTTTNTATWGRNQYISGFFVVDISLTQTNFKIGDNLRLNLVISAGASGKGIYLIGANPSLIGIDTTSYPTAKTDSALYVPFKIDL